MDLNKIFLGAAITVMSFASCSEYGFMEDVYVEPVASFSTPKDTYDVFESVVFTNTGAGQNYVVYTGDNGHDYYTDGDTGFATATNGTFSYSYNEPGEYKVVWVASSVNSKGEVEKKTAESVIVVEATDGGLDNLTITKLCKLSEYGNSVFYNSKGIFVDNSTLVCPVLFDAWNDKSFYSIKAKQLLSFQLSSSLASFYWFNKEGEPLEIKSDVSTSRIVEFSRDGKLEVQRFKVVTASGYETEYFVAPVMIPLFTSFEVAGVQATITRDIAYYEKYNVELELPEGTDLTSLVPTFEVMNNDINLIDGTNVSVTVNGVEQTSGVTSVDFSSGQVIYTIKYRLMGYDNEKFTQTSEMVVTVK